MTRSDLSKLFILVIVVIIICLPDILRPGVNFRCITFDPCRHQEVTSLCDHRHTPVEQKPVCTDNPSDTWYNVTDSKTIWFLCHTEADLSGLYGNTSMSGKRASISVVWVEGNATITLNGILTEERKERDDKRNKEGQAGIYCCLQTSLPSAPTNSNQCLIHIYTQRTNHNVSSEVLRSSMDYLWVLVVVVVVVVMLSTPTVVQTCMETRCCRSDHSVSSIRHILPDQTSDGVSPERSQGLPSKYRTSCWTTL
ncbi:hypothetical protein DPEC_G00180500 [Dallia pectoralis]|uniref:Uncharacterized protein n=1 Tax=Dallia pectoralis TaxID=75939 RepID=A0ACC2GAH0_DALPE|nr:hypothetical protein DPEC_G00180500 [Dallia pectoralis]